MSSKPGKHLDSQVINNSPTTDSLDGIPKGMYTRSQKEVKWFQRFLKCTDEKKQIVSILSVMSSFLIQFRSLSSFKILDLGCGTGAVSLKLMLSLEKLFDRLKLEYIGLDSNSDYVLATQISISERFSSTTRVGNCFDVATVRPFLLPDVNLILMSHVAYWGNTQPLIQEMQAMCPNALLVFIHQHYASSANQIRKECTSGVGTDVTFKISQNLGKSYELLVPASVHFNRPQARIAEAAVQCSSGYGQDTQDDIDLTSFVTQRDFASQTDSQKLLAVEATNNKKVDDYTLVFWDFFQVATGDQGFAKQLPEIFRLLRERASLSFKKCIDFVEREGNSEIWSLLKQEQSSWYSDLTITRLLKLLLPGSQYYIAPILPLQ